MVWDHVLCVFFGLLLLLFRISLSRSEFCWTCLLGLRGFAGFLSLICAPLLCLLVVLVLSLWPGGLGPIWCLRAVDFLLVRLSWFTLLFCFAFNEFAFWILVVNFAWVCFMGVVLLVTFTTSALGLFVCYLGGMLWSWPAFVWVVGY